MKKKLILLLMVVCLAAALTVFVSAASSGSAEYNGNEYTISAALWFLKSDSAATLTFKEGAILDEAVTLKAGNKLIFNQGSDYTLSKITGAKGAQIHDADAGVIYVADSTGAWIPRLPAVAAVSNAVTADTQTGGAVYNTVGAYASNALSSTITAYGVLYIPSAAVEDVNFDGLKDQRDLNYSYLSSPYATYARLENNPSASGTTFYTCDLLISQSMLGRTIINCWYIEYKIGDRTAYILAQNTTEDKGSFKPNIELGYEVRAGEFKVSSAFSDDMIIQRDETITIWGFAPFAENGHTVYASILGSTGSATIVDEKWTIVLPKKLSANSNSGNTLYVWGEDGTRTSFTDVLIGDVYVIAGQSNVFMSLDHYKHFIPSYYANLQITEGTDIRLFRNSNEDSKYYSGYAAEGTPYAEVYEDVVQTRGWQKPEEPARDITKSNYYYYETNKLSGYYPKTAEVFSALGYLFAAEMDRFVSVPIGVIDIDISGYPIYSFMPNEMMDELQLDRIGTSIRGNYCYVDKVNSQATRFGYNQQIYPIKNFSIAGLIWYHGEGECQNTYNNTGVFANTYNDLFLKLMNYYRENSPSPDFPIFVIEFPPCYSNGGANVTLDTGALRSELCSTPAELENSYIVSSADIFYDTTFHDNIHPYTKDATAYRLGTIARAVNNGMGDIDKVCGPTFKSASYSDTGVTVYFDHYGQGLGFGGVIYAGGIEVRLSENSNVWTAITDPAAVALVDPDANGSCDALQITTGVPVYAVRYNAKTDGFYPNTCNLINSVAIPAPAFADYR